MIYSRDFFLSLSNGLRFRRGLLILLVLAAILVRGNFFAPSGDPDFFWHLKAGEYIIANGEVPGTDPFSFSMPDFRWVNHEWLSDVFLTAVQQRFGIHAFGWLYAGIFAVAVYLASAARKKKLNVLDFILCIVGVVSLLPYAGVRQQEFSFLFFAGLLFLLSGEGIKYDRLIPLIFLAWVNLHGGFVLGIAVLALYSGSLWYLGRISPGKYSGAGRYALLCAVSVLFTLINPYGFEIYGEVYRTVGDGRLASSVAEWSPAVFHLYNSVQYSVFLALVLILAPFFIGKIPVQMRIIFLVLLLLPFRAAKYVPYFIIGFLPLLLSVTGEFLTPELVAGYRKRLRQPFTVVVVLPVFLLAVVFLFPSLLFSANGFFYPRAEAIAALSDIPETRIFNHYNWGGYLIATVPGKKYFIDGRMPSWVANDGSSVFADYLTVASCKKIPEIFSRYDIRAVFWTEQRPAVSFRYFPRMLDAVDKKISGKIFGISEDCRLSDELIRNGWKTAYMDDTAILLVR